MFTASRALLTKASPVLLFLAPTPSFAEPSFEEPSPSSTPTIVAASWFSALKPDEPATGATAATPATVPAAKAKARAKAKAVPAPDWTAILNKAYSEATTGAFNEASHTVSLGLGNSVKSLTATGVPNQITSGFVSGFAAGYALKKIGKFAMFVAGAGFVGMQYLSFHGYIDVDYDEVSKDINDMIKSQTGGNDVDMGDMQHVYERAYEIASYNMPAGGGFSTGFVFGVKQG